MSEQGERGAPRVLLLTGKGGVGKTTIAAATAVRAAADGARVLLTSTDPAHSLADVLDVELGDQPTRVAERLHAQQLDSHARLERRWGDIRDFVIRLLAGGGLTEVEAEELLVLPGLDELFALLDLREQAERGRWDALVVDCAPTAETLRLLSLPEVVRWYADRLGSGRQIARAVAPVARAVGAEVPMPDQGVLDAVGRLEAEMTAVHELLRDRDRASIRLVTTPERVALAETTRTRATLALFGFGVDAVLVNRVLPDDVSDPRLTTWRERHAEHTAAAREAFAPTPVLRVPLAADEPVGPGALSELAATCWGELDPLDVLHRDEPRRIEETSGGWVLRLSLPSASRDELDVARRGGELLVRVGSARRTVPLPARLRRCEVAGARLRDGALEVRFVATAVA